MGQFGFEIQASSEWIISKRLFKKINIPKREIRPFEGDLLLVGNYQSTEKDPIYTNSLFEITFVKREYANWQLGRYFVWTLNCELYTASDEKFETGNTHIDRIQTQYNNENNVENAINDELEVKKENIVDFTEDNPFGSL